MVFFKPSPLLVICVVIATAIQLNYDMLQKDADKFGIFNIDLDMEVFPEVVVDLCGYLRLDLNEDGHLSTLECISAIAKITSVALFASGLLKRVGNFAYKKTKRSLKDKRKKTRLISLAGCILIFVIAQFQLLYTPIKLKNINVSRCVCVNIIVSSVYIFSMQMCAYRCQGGVGIRTRLGMAVA